MQNSQLRATLAVMREEMEALQQAAAAAAAVAAAPQQQQQQQAPVPVVLPPDIALLKAELEVGGCGGLVAA